MGFSNVCVWGWGRGREGREKKDKLENQLLLGFLINLNKKGHAF